MDPRLHGWYGRRFGRENLKRAMNDLYKISYDNIQSHNISLNQIFMAPSSKLRHEMKCCTLSTTTEQWTKQSDMIQMCETG
jgi:hypothetical protein